MSQTRICVNIDLIVHENTMMRNNQTFPEGRMLSVTQRSRHFKKRFYFISSSVAVDTCFWSSSCLTICHGLLVIITDSVFNVAQFGFQVVTAFLFL